MHELGATDIGSGAGWSDDHAGQFVPDEAVTAQDYDDEPLPAAGDLDGLDITATEEDDESAPLFSSLGALTIEAPESDVHDEPADESTPVADTDSVEIISESPSGDDESPEPPAAAGSDSGNDEPPEGPPPVETPEPPGDDDEASSPHQPYSSGQIRDVLTRLNDVLPPDGEGSLDLLPLTERQRDALPLLLDPDMTNEAIAEQLLIPKTTVSAYGGRIIQKMLNNIEPESLPADLPEPAGRIIGEERDNVGTFINETRKEQGLTLTQLASEFGVSPVTLRYFFNGDTQPRSAKMLEPLMERLGVPDALRQEYRALYDEERPKAPAPDAQSATTESPALRPLHDPVEVSSATAENIARVVTRVIAEWVNEPAAVAGEPSRRRSRGQIPDMLAGIQEKLSEQNVTVESLIPEKATALREAAPLLLDPDMTDDVISERLGVATSYVADMRRRLLDTTIRHAPENALPPELIRPAAGSDAPRQNVGSLVNGIRKALGVDVADLAAAVGVTQPTLSRLFTGTTRPDPYAVVAPLLRILHIPPEIAGNILDAYKEEIAARARLQQLRREFRRRNQ
ncbi:MAG TPA: helix-turn-helix domain-containing protein [Candidatus Saccharimonadales bacterium]|jgi:transcriptional regulator with XRE-family HTH domain|nr:helix-turn-helix domain-containing protein [Candidatus Saccharimonadales bacterium]